MWSIAIWRNGPDSIPVLECSNFASPDVSQIDISLLSSTEPNRNYAKLEIYTLHAEFQNKISMRLNTIIEEYEIEFGTDHGEMRKITCCIPIDYSFEKFNAVIAMLEGIMHSFPEIKQQVVTVLQPSREAIVTTYTLYRQNYAKRFEGYVDNNVSVVHESLRMSDQRLRQKYGFANPNYTIHNYEPLDEADVVIPDIAYEGYSKHYLALENFIIKDLQGKLAALQLEMLHQEYLIAANNKVELSPGALKLLQQYNLPIATILGKTNFSKREQKQLRLQQETARTAMDVMVAVRALNDGGSYAHNAHMTQTTVKGYGIRNMVALVWYAVMRAPEPHIDGFKLQPADRLPESELLKIMARAIADGARGWNRNDQKKDDADTRFYEDLAEDDVVACGKGKYNDLLAAFVTILKEIEIDFSPMDSFIGFLKSAFIKMLLNDPLVRDLYTARQFINAWTGKSNITSLEYSLFCRKVNEAYPNLYNSFLESYCGDAEMSAVVKDTLDKDIAGAISLGNTMMETLNLQTELDTLEDEWNKHHVPSPRKRHETSSPRTSNLTLSKVGG